MGVICKFASLSLFVQLYETEDGVMLYVAYVPRWRRWLFLSTSARAYRTFYKVVDVEKAKSICRGYADEVLEEVKKLEEEGAIVEVLRYTDVVHL